LLHGTQETSADLRVRQRGIDQQKQALRAGGEGPHRQLAGDDSAKGLGLGASSRHQVARVGVVVVVVSGGVDGIFLNACLVDAL
jgi:hypothetical protein